MLRRTVTLLSLFAATLLAGDRAQQIADQLKKLAGQTLDRPVLFVKYGDDKFDWLVVTADGNYAAKLEGMNPDGSFNYTILGDPAKYGIKLDVSLDGVKVHALPPQANFQNTLSQKEQCEQRGGKWLDDFCVFIDESSSNSSSSSAQSTVAVEQKVKTADLAISTLIANPTFTSPAGGSTRNLAQKTANPLITISKAVTAFSSKLRPTYTRQVFTQPCDDGGSVTVSVNSSETHATWSFRECEILGVTFNGTIDMTSYDDGYHIQGSYRNFTTKTAQFTTSVPSATFSMSTNYNDELENFTLQIPRSSVTYHRSNITVEVKNYRLTLRESGSSLFLGLIGDYKASCQESWTHAETKRDIHLSMYSTCPVGGALQVSNDETELKVQFNRNGSIDIIDSSSGELIEHYSSCHNIPSIEEVCAR